MASDKEIQIIQYIKHSVKAYGRMPSSKELCIDVEIGRGSLGRIFKYLVVHHKLKRVPPIFEIRYKL